MADWKPPVFEGEIKNYTPTLRDRVAYGISGLMSGRGELGPDRERMTRARMIANALEYTPFGFATMADDTTRDVGRGDYLGAGINLAMAAIPGPNTKGIRAYHGSPHSFDKFSMDKIGTGEGAQAYGHGLYFAENEGVARDYRNRLAPPSNPTVGGQPITPALIRDVALDIGIEYPGQSVGVMASRLKTSDDVANYAEKLNSINMDELRATFPKVAQDVEVEKAIFGELQKRGLNVERPNKGYMYEVSINADPGQFLDWDKPLSEQPESVRKAVRNVAAKAPDPKKGPAKRNREAILTDDQNVTGDVLWNNLGGYSSPNEAMKAWREAGVPGIKYLDQGSRAKGDGSRNYVVFDDSLIDIKRKYALIAALLGGGGLAAATNTGEAQAGTPQPQGGGGGW